MGYQVGNTCYTDQRLAEDVYFSQAVPLVTDEGVKQIFRKSDGWYYQTHKIEAHLPQCDPAANYKLGLELGWELVPTALVLMSAGLIIRLMK